MSRRGLAPLLLAATLLGAADSQAAEQLTLPVPQGWKTLTTLNTASLRMSEFAVPVPSGEVDKLSFEWFALDLAPGEDPIAVAKLLGTAVRAQCPDSQDQPVFAGMENGYPTVLRLVTCPLRNPAPAAGDAVSGKQPATGDAATAGSDGVDQPPHGEVMMIKAVQGATGFWVMVRGRQVPPFTRAADAVPGDTIATWSRDFRSITLCDPDAGKLHPCPADAQPDDSGPAPVP